MADYVAALEDAVGTLERALKTEPEDLSAQEWTRVQVCFERIGAALEQDLARDVDAATGSREDLEASARRALAPKRGAPGRESAIPLPHDIATSYAWKQAAYEEGWRARRQGLAVTQNPYKGVKGMGGAKRIAWARAWAAVT